MRTTRLLLTLCFVAFISLGLPDGLLGVAWPSIRAWFGLPLDALGPLLIAFVSGYVGASFASGRLLEHLSVGALLALSCLATAISLLGYAFAPGWYVMVGFGVLAGIGAGAIDAGLNTYVALHYNARTLNLLHAFYGVGAAGGPLIMTSVLMSGSAWQRGYQIVAAGQLLLAGAFVLTLRRWPAPQRRSADPSWRRSSLRSTAGLPAAWLGILSFFLYTGMEASAGAWAYTLLTESRGLGMAAAGLSVSSLWVGLMTGRLIAGLALTSLPVARVLWSSIALTGVATVMMIVPAPTMVSRVGLALLGLACGPIFPSLIATTEQRVGRSHTANTVGFQIAAAALGQSALPALIGTTAANFGLEAIAWMLAALSLALLATNAWMTATIGENRIADRSVPT